MVTEKYQKRFEKNEALIHNNKIIGQTATKDSGGNYVVDGWILDPRP